MIHSSPINSAFRRRILADIEVTGRPWITGLRRCSQGPDDPYPEGRARNDTSGVTSAIEQ